MKQVKLVVAGLMIISSSMVIADEAKQAAPPQAHVVLTSINPLAFGSDIKVGPSDYPNGVFVRVKEIFGERPVSSRIFADKLRSRGFKIAEFAEKADVIFTVRSSSIDFKEIDSNSDSMISGNRADAAAGIVITAVVTGGISLLSSDYSALGNSKPIYQSMSIFIEPTNKDLKAFETGLDGAIKADARNAKVTRAFFDIMSDEWLKAHLRQDDGAQPALPSGSTTQ